MVPSGLEDTTLKIPHTPRSLNKICVVYSSFLKKQIPFELRENAKNAPGGLKSRGAIFRLTIQNPDSVIDYEPNLC
ncbi:hypothetical protein OROMI_029436 [Orobanche minor]